MREKRKIKFVKTKTYKEKLKTQSDISMNKENLLMKVIMNKLMMILIKII